MIKRTKLYHENNARNPSKFSNKEQNFTVKTTNPYKFSIKRTKLYNKNKDGVDIITLLVDITE